MVPPVILEGTTPIYSVTLVDHNDKPINSIALVSLTLTYYDGEALAILNNRSDQDILNANGVTVTAAGVVEWFWAVADATPIDRTQAIREHVAFLTWTWTTAQGLATGRHEAHFFVKLAYFGDT